MSANVKYGKFRSYSGPIIRGTDPMPSPSGSRADHHVDRAFWLTAMVESGGKIGAVMAADGTGMTIGLDQHIAVYPRELAHEDYNAKDDQGSLWKLLYRLETVRSSQSYHKAVDVLWDMLLKEGWFVAQDGVLRYLHDQEVTVGPKTLEVDAGDVVFGAQIRDVFTPPGGKVPQKSDNWQRSKRWALAFHAITSHFGAEAAQISYGQEHLVKRTKRRRLKIDMGAGKKPRWGKLEKMGYDNREVSSLKLGDTWSEDMDLALCVYQSHSVNAPSIANKCVVRARKKASTDAAFAKWLLRFLGNNSYGRWDSGIKHGRYQRTRSAARASGLWPKSLFDGPRAIMPRDLPG